MTRPATEPTHRDRRAGLLLVAAAATLWGTWPLYVRDGAPQGPAMALLVMACMALPAPFSFRRADFGDRGAVIALGLVGLADAGNVALYFPALAQGPVVVAVLTHYLAPLLVALTAPWVLGEPRSLRALVAVPVVLLGLALVLGLSGLDGGAGHTALLGGGSAIFYATLVVASRRAGRTFSPVAVMALHSVVSAAALLLVFGRQAVPQVLDAGLLRALLGALVNGLGGAWLFNLGLRPLGAQLTGVLTYLEPLTASLVGVVWFHEPFAARSALGVAVVLGAGAFVALEPVRAERQTPPSPRAPSTPAPSEEPGRSS